MRPTLTPGAIFNLVRFFFILRSWRLRITKNEKYSVTESFMTQNAYICTEINGHSLINVLVRCRDAGMENLYLEASHLDIHSDKFDQCSTPIQLK